VDCHKAQHNVDDAYVALFDLRVDELALQRMLPVKEKCEYRVAQLLEAKHQVQQNRIQAKRAFLEALLQDYKLICGINPSPKVQKQYDLESALLLDPDSEMFFRLRSDYEDDD